MDVETKKQVDEMWAKLGLGSNEKPTKREGQ
jgi:hypothetical protein